MGEVIVADIATRLDVPAERILKAALKAGVSRVVIVGYTEDGEEYFAASIASGATVLWLLERAKLRLLTGDD